MEYNNDAIHLNNYLFKNIYIYITLPILAVHL